MSVNGVFWILNRLQHFRCVLQLYPAQLDSKKDKAVIIQHLYAKCDVSAVQFDVKSNG